MWIINYRLIIYFEKTDCILIWYIDDYIIVTTKVTALTNRHHNHYEIFFKHIVTKMKSKLELYKVQNKIP